MEDNPVISYCGLYCSNCKRFQKGTCPGCSENTKATWCKIRTCAQDRNYKSCAECSEPGVENCKKINNPVSKIFALVFNSDREAAIQLIKDEGYEGFALHMQENNKMTVPRRGKK